MKNKQPSKTFAEIIGQYLGQPFKPAGCGCGGYGCIDLCYKIIAEGLGKEMPGSMGELTAENYRDILKGDRKLEEKYLRMYFRGAGQEIEVNRVLPGDLILVKVKDNLFPAVYVGSNHAITSLINTGVEVFAIEYGWIEMVRRFD